MMRLPRPRVMVLIAGLIVVVNGFVPAIWIELTNPRQAFVTSKLRQLVGRPRESCTCVAIAGSMFVRETEALMRRPIASGSTPAVSRARRPAVIAPST